LSEDNFYARALGDPGLSSFSDQAKFLSLTNTPTIPTASAALNGPGQDVMTYIGTGPINLMSGQKDTVAFALVVGDGLNDILSQSAAAQEAYDCILKGQGPISPFTIADPTASAGVPLQFQDNNPNATTWQWDFGDGTTASSANPQHTYSQHGRYTVSLKVSDGTCHFESQQSISVGFATDLEEVLPLDWVISPNPAREEIRIEGFAEGAGFAELQITSLLGQQIWAYQWQQGAGAVQQSLALPTLAPGVYMLSIRSGERQQQQLLQIR
ncbi:MAG: PKD domain-containing protein, partial [Bacteroidota bacterium]